MILKAAHQRRLRRHIKFIAAKGGDTTPFEPARWKRAEPSEPFEPCHAVAPMAALFLLLFPLHNARMCWNKKP